MKKYNSKRLIDLDYLKQNFYKKPKQIHADLIKIVSKEISKRKSTKASLVDFGCADGQFLFHLNKLKLKNISLNGVDVHDKLIKKAKIKNNNEINFRTGSILNRKIYSKNSIDVITATGVLPIFFDYKPIFENIFYWIKPGGLIVIASIFNDYNYDVFINYNESTKKNMQTTKKKFGWNIFSKKTIEFFLNKNKKVKKYYFKNFDLNVKIAKNNKNLLKMWTIDDSKKKKICVNGLSIILDQKFLIIKTKN